MARDEGETTSALTTEKSAAVNILHSPQADCSLIRSRPTRLNRSAPAVTLSNKHGRQREQDAQIPEVRFRRHMSVALQTFRIGKVRFILTALGMVIGTASLILVVTIGLTGKQYLLQQIQNIGSNMMIAEYSGGSLFGSDATSDLLTLADLDAVTQQVPGISNASPMIE